MSDNPHQPPESSSSAPSKGVPDNTAGIAPKRREAAVIFIFITVLLDALSLGVTIPVLPKLVEEFTGGDLQLASRYHGWFVSVWALMQFICSPIMGALSDRFGRRPVILLSCLGLGLDYILMALAPNFTWLFIGRVISGITAASFSTAGAYIADVTLPEKRAASYGMLGAAFGLGFVIGPAMGGMLGKNAFWLAAFLTILNAIYGAFILPESLSKKNRRAFSWRRANPLGSLKLLRSHPELLGLASIMFLYQLSHQVFQTVFVFYTEHRYHWTGETTGLTLTVVGLMSVLMQGVIVRRTAPKLGERRMLIIALAFGAAGYVIYALARESWVFWLGIPVFSLVSYFSAAIQGLMTRRVSASEQGQLQGANSSIMGIAGMIGPWIFASIFSFAIRDNIKTPGLPFFFACSLHIVALVVAIIIVKPTRQDAPQS